ncbi:hypothetical protein OG322_22730 [Streptomyces sp. NBC_01260]|uniref:hypothetical protein n=1 Tax=unclassified Streptomyces TaxID=2593676 RepID=UPI002889A355|nr:MULTISPECIES: hypothetical protein [unclassified Streptomyces]WNI31509.1 hypothetical protein RLT59_23980 [Streptomyces sp. ITFR-6]
MSNAAAPSGLEWASPLPEEDVSGDRHCLSVLASPSCFGFLAFVGSLIAACAWHDLAI